MSAQTQEIPRTLDRDECQFERPVLGRSDRAAGEVQVVEFDVASGRTRFALLLVPDDEDLDPSRMAVPSDFLAAISVRAPRNTQKARAYDLALWFGWCLQTGARWREADARMLTHWVTALQVTPPGERLGARSGAVLLSSRRAREASSIRRAVQSVKALYTWAADNDLVADTVRRRVQSFAPPKAPKNTTADRLDANQIRTLLTEARKRPRDHFFVRVMYGCGLRIGQALALQFRDLHFEVDNYAAHGCSIRGAHLHVQPREEADLPAGVAHKVERPYWVPAGSAVVDAYGEWLVQRMDALGDDDPSPYVFVSLHGPARGQPWTMAAAQKRMQRLAAALGWQGAFNAHLLRHTFASELADLGTPTFTMQSLLGHAHPDSTAVYVHPLAEQMTEAVAKLTAHRKERMSW